MKVELTPCYILHRRDYSESSLILEVFSREHGRINLIAKGAKRNKKQQGINHNLYQKYHMSWVAKSELGTLIDIELPSISGSLKAEIMMTGFYMNEILLRLLHKHESHPELFDSYDAAINRLINNMPEQIVLRYYEKTLLQSLGYGVILDHDVASGESINAEKDYYYKFDFGPSLESNNSDSGVSISGKTLLELDAETLSDSKNINEAKILLRLILDQHLGERPLASRELYQAYLKNKKLL
jgi:DNA repair protein RecO (recombination protein O)